MYTQNTSATVNSAIGAAPNSPPIGSPYYGQNPAVRYEFVGAWYGNTEGDYGFKGIYIYRSGVQVWANSYGNNPTDASRVSGSITSYGGGGSADYNPWLLCDTTFTWKTYAWGNFSTAWTLKTIAKPIAQGPVTFSTSTKTSIPVTVGWFPNTNESTATMTLYYKKVSESVWNPWGTTSGPQTGYAGSSFSTTVTGLESGTTYQFRVVISRTVSPAEANTTWDIGTAATLPANPTVTTQAATGVTDTYAVLNASLDPNTITCTVTFEYGETSGALNLVTGSQEATGDGARAVSAGAAELSNGTLYYFRVKVTYDLGAGLVTIYGDELSFTTTADQGALARAEDLMQTLQFDGQYGTGRFITFTLKTKATDGSDQYYVTAAPSAAQCKVYLTTEAGVTTGPTDATNTPTQPGGASTPVFSLELSDAEMAAETVDIVVTSGGATFRDQHIQVRTAQRLSEMDLDATNGPTNATALTCIGTGSGDGIKAIGGASGLDINAILESNWLRVGAARTQGTEAANKIRLDAASSSTNDYYNGVIVAILSGACAGQSRIAVGYVGGADPEVDGTREIEVDTDWVGDIPDSTSIYALAPGPRTWEMRSPGELDSLPDEESSYGEFLRLIFQRFAFKIDQNADYQTWYKADNVATFASRAVEDDGNTQRLYRLAE